MNTKNFLIDWNPYLLKDLERIHSGYGLSEKENSITNRLVSKALLNKGLTLKELNSFYALRIKVEEHAPF